MNDADFQAACKKLNPAQLKAVKETEGPVMVIAGPGTGKTTILTLRIANILRSPNTPPSGILAITFTDAGVKAMRKSLRKIIGSQADEVHIYTFHSFAASVIKEFSEHFPRISRAQQMTDIEAQELVREILKDKKYKAIRPDGEPDLYVSSILKSISDAKRDDYASDAIRKYIQDEIERIKNDPDSISTRGASKGQIKADAKRQIQKAEKTMLFADVYDAYEAEKKARGKIDFDDLIYELLKAVRDDELLKSLLQEKYLYILVDEHQDTNDSQNEIIRILASFFDTPNLFVVGDEKQAIYRFQGASVKNFLQFQKMWKDIQIIRLEENYRSHQHILDAGFSLIENNYLNDEYKDLRVKLKSGVKEAARPIDVIVAGNTAAADLALVDRLKRFSETNEKGQGTMTAAVIVPRNRDVERLATICEAYGIHAVSERGINIFIHPIGALFFELISFLNDPSQVESFAVTLASGLWNIGFAQSVEYIRLVKSGKAGDVLQKLPIVALIREELSERGALAFLVYAASKSGLLEVVMKSPASAEVWRGIIALAGELVARDRAYADDPRQLIGALLSYRATAESRSVKIVSGAPDAPIRIMTAHGSKGLEYDEVFLPYAVNESWIRHPHSNYFVLPNQTKAEGDDLRDSRRLFYVALTRARRHVTIITPLEDGSGKAFTPLSFVDELADAKVQSSESVARIEIPAVQDDALILAKTRGKDKRAKELTEYAKTVLVEKGLSVTALNHFLECPQKFLYKSILKVPEPPSVSGEMGNAMHLAMDRVWHLARPESRSLDKKQIEAEILASTREYLDGSLLPSFEKEAVREELTEIAPEVSAVLVEHFAQPGETFTETWFEAQEGNTLLHGKMDAVIVDPNSDIVRVFDYKTKEKMSEAEIRGETKSSSGNEFRQLIFYYILLSAQSKYKGKRIEPALVFVKPDDKGRCPTVVLPISVADVTRVKGEISKLVESVQSGALIDARCDDEECEWCRLAKMR